MTKRYLFHLNLWWIGSRWISAALGIINHYPVAPRPQKTPPSAIFTPLLWSTSMGFIKMDTIWLWRLQFANWKINTMLLRTVNHRTFYGPFPMAMLVITRGYHFLRAKWTISAPQFHVSIAPIGPSLQDRAGSFSAHGIQISCFFKGKSHPHHMVKLNMVYHGLPTWDMYNAFSCTSRHFFLAESVFVLDKLCEITLICRLIANFCSFSQN